MIKVGMIKFHINIISLLYFVRFNCNNLHQQYFTACPAGYYGKLCSQVCDNCANNSTCNPRDGHCECLPGWTASDCSERELTGFGKYFLPIYLDDCLAIEKNLYSLSQKNKSNREYEAEFEISLWTNFT